MSSDLPISPQGERLMLKPATVVHQPYITRLNWSPMGDHLAVAHAQGISFWNQAFGGDPTHTLEAETVVKSLAPHPHEPVWALGLADTNISLWNPMTQTINVMQGNKEGRGAVSAVCFAGANMLLSGDGAGVIRLWDYRQSTLVSEFQAHQKEITGLLYRVTEDIVSISRDGSLAIWTPDGELIAKFQHEEGLRAVTSSHDGRWLISACRDGTISLWDTLSQTLERRIDAHEGSVDSISLSPSGRLLASGGHDAVMNVWDLQSGRLVVEDRSHDRPVLTLAFHPRSPWLVSGSGDNTIRLYRLTTANGN